MIPEITRNPYDPELGRKNWRARRKPWPKPTTLNEKQLLFCEEYIRNGLDYSKAAKFAGFKGGYGLSLLKKRLIRQYITDRQAKIVEQIKGPTNWKYKKLQEIVEKADLSAPGIKDALAAITEMNKMDGDYAPTKSFNVDLKMDPDMLKLKELTNKLMLEYKSEIIASGEEAY